VKYYKSQFDIGPSMKLNWFHLVVLATIAAWLAFMWVHAGIPLRGGGSVTAMKGLYTGLLIAACMAGWKGSSRHMHDPRSPYYSWVDHYAWWATLMGSLTLGVLALVLSASAA
jgi:hypothetical protein